MEIRIVGKKRFVELKLGVARQVFNLDYIVRVMGDENGTYIELINGCEYFSPERFEDVLARLSGYDLQLSNSKSSLKCD